MLEALELVMQLSYKKLIGINSLCYERSTDESPVQRVYLQKYSIMMDLPSNDCARL